MTILNGDGIPLMDILAFGVGQKVVMMAVLLGNLKDEKSSFLMK